MNPITYKLVLDSEGAVSGLELHQAGQYITISLGAVIGPAHGSYHWTTLKKTIDDLQQRTRDQSTSHRIVTREIVVNGKKMAQSEVIEP